MRPCRVSLLHRQQNHGSHIHISNERTAFSHGQEEVREQTVRAKRYAWLLYDCEFPRLFQFKYSGLSLEFMYLFELIKQAHTRYKKNKIYPNP